MKKEIIKINKINKAFRENPVLIDLDFSVYDNDVIYIKVYIVESDLRSIRY